MNIHTVTVIYLLTNLKNVPFVVHNNKNQLIKLSLTCYFHTQL